MLKKSTKIIVGVVLIIIGFLLGFVPFVPGIVLVVIGLQLLGLGFLISVPLEKIRRKFGKKEDNANSS